jgi:hypothetical protein
MSSREISVFAHCGLSLTMIGSYPRSVLVSLPPDVPCPDSLGYAIPFMVVLRKAEKIKAIINRTSSIRGMSCDSKWEVRNI